MSTETPRILLEIRYHDAAQEYLRKLPLTHFMEATPQATQRKITLESLDLVVAGRPDVHVFNELLVQYPLPRRKKPGQVVPDNMVVIHPEPLHAVGSYDVPLQPARPFWMLEYVSRSSKRKDYDDNVRKYEHELQVPYYLLFAPDEQEMTLYRHTGEKYVSVKPNEHERYAIEELDLEMAILDGWMRYWYRGELLPLPADLLHQLEATREKLKNVQEKLDDTQDKLHEAQSEANAERQARLAMEEQLLNLQAKLKDLEKQEKSDAESS